MPVQPITAQLKLPKLGGTKQKSGTKVAKQASSKATKAVKAGTQALKKTASKAGGTQRLGGVGYRKYAGDALWLPNTQRPEWLDGSLPGDRGFDPLELGRPRDYVQFELDGNDITKEQNDFGQVAGAYEFDTDELTDNPLSPYGDAFGLQRFRECELQHGRWAMLACLGILVAESTTGVAWQDAGKVELDGASYLGFKLPFSITQLVWIEVLAMGWAEIYRNTQLDPEKRLYPGGIFDPLKLASEDQERAFRLKEAEIKHSRLAMVSFLGFSIQALYGKGGALGSLAKFAQNLSGEIPEAIVEAIEETIPNT